MKEYIVILNFETEETLYHEILDSDRELLEKDSILYSDEGLSKFFDKFNIDPDKCLWMFTNTFPKLIEI